MLEAEAGVVDNTTNKGGLVMCVASRSVPLFCTCGVATCRSAILCQSGNSDAAEASLFSRFSASLCLSRMKIGRSTSGR